MEPPTHPGCCEAPRGAGVISPERSHSSQEGRTLFLSLSPTRILILICGPRGLWLNPDFGGGRRGTTQSQFGTQFPIPLEKQLDFRIKYIS